MDHARERQRLSRALASAADHRIQMAVAMVDALPERGAADELVAPLRPRLARIGAPRGLNFTRLLFLPLDPVIVPNSVWRRNAPGIPRSALASLGRVARQAWPADEKAALADADARLATLTTADAERVLAAGGRVWTTAASCLLSSPPPDDWTQSSGLATEDFAPLVGTTSLVLTQGLEVVRLRYATDDAPTLDAELAGLCGAALATLIAPGRVFGLDTAEGKTALATLLAALLLRSPRPDRVLATAERLGGGDKRQLGAAQLALEFALARQVASVTESALAHAAEAVGSAATTLSDLDAMMECRPAPRQQLQEARQALDAACRTRLAAAFAELVAAIHATPTDAAELEAMTRDIRQFERAARRIGGAEVYDRIVGEVVARLAAPAAGGPQARDSSSLTAILLDPAAP